jgi:hypothetical protein
MEQQHPQRNTDLGLLQNLSTLSDEALAEVARLLIRYQDYPEEKEIHQLIQSRLAEWKLTQVALFQRTRQIHNQRAVFRGEGQPQEDWS